MGIARNIARLIPNNSGLLPNANIEAMAASKLTGQVPDANAPSGSVVQVVQTFKSDTFATSASDTYVDITGMSASITPISASNRVLVLVYMNYSSDNNTWPGVRLIRGATFISGGDPAGSRDAVSLGTGFNFTESAVTMVSGNIAFLDSPNTTSSVTYKLQAHGRTSFGIFSLNRSAPDFNDQFSGKRAASSIILLEISA